MNLCTFSCHLVQIPRSVLLHPAPSSEHDREFGDLGKCGAPKDRLRQIENRCGEANPSSHLLGIVSTARDQFVSCSPSSYFRLLYETSSVGWPRNDYDGL